MTERSFDFIWCDGEAFQQGAHPNATVQSTMEELTLKVGLYKAIDAKSSDIPVEELQLMKDRMMGEILLTLALLSAIDNINVASALYDALQSRSINHYDQKHPL